MMERHLPAFIVDGGESTRDAVVILQGATQDVSTRNDTAARTFSPVMVCSILHLEDDAGHNELLLTTVLSGLMGLIQPQKPLI